MSRSTIVYEGLSQFRHAPVGFEMDYHTVPGLSALHVINRTLPSHAFPIGESGWNPDLEEMCVLIYLHSLTLILNP